MKNKITEVISTVEPNLINWLGALVGMCVTFWSGLPPLAQALIIVQAADIITGLFCAVTGKSLKTESGKLSSAALFGGVAKKGLEWLVVGVCVYVGGAMEMQGISGAAMTYMIATELVSLIENLKIFGINMPLLDTILDIAHNKSGMDKDE